MPDKTTYRQINASCHCGNIRVAFDWPVSLWPIPVRACGCTLCTKHRGVWTSHPQGRFQLRIADASKVAQYRFGTKTADFHVCLTCGVIPIVTCALEGTRDAVVNVNTFDDVDRSSSSRPPPFRGRDARRAAWRGVGETGRPRRARRSDPDSAGVTLSSRGLSPGPTHPLAPCISARRTPGSERHGRASTTGQRRRPRGGSRGQTPR